MKSVKHRGKERIKVEYNVTIIRVKGLNKSLNGSTVFVEWKRGSSRTSGTTRRVLVNNQQAGWDEVITFTSTIFKTTNADKFDEKAIKFYINEDQPKKKKVNEIGTIGLDLSQYVRSDGSEHIILPLKKKSNESAALELKIRSQWLKYNNKVLIKADDSSKLGISGKDKQKVEIEGQEYVMKTDSNVSDTTVDTMSVISDFDDDHEVTFEDNSYHSADEGKDDSKESKKKVSNAPENVLNRERLQTIETQKKEVDFLRKQLAELKQENTDKLKALSMMETEKQELLDQIQMLKGRSDPSNVQAHDKMKERIKQLKENMADKEKKILLLEETKEKLERKLEFFTKKQNEDDIKLKISTLEQELEKKNTILAKQERELKKVKKATHSKGDEEQVQKPVAATNGKLEEMQQLREQLDEKFFIESCIYNSTISFTNNISNVCSNLFRTILSWKVFQKPIKTRFLQSIVHALETTSKRSEYDLGMLSFWLSTLTAFLYKLRQEQTNATMKENLQEKEVANALSKFESELSSLLFDLYCMFLRIVCKRLDSILVFAFLESQKMCIVHEKLARMRAVTDILTEALNFLQENHNPDSLISQLFSQIFWFINAMLFNNLLRRKDLCTVTNGFQIKLEISQLEEWISQKGGNVIYKSKDELEHIIQAANILVMDKSSLSDADTLSQVSPLLNMIQVKLLLESFTPDQLSLEPVPGFVFQQLNEKLNTMKRQGKNFQENLDTNSIKPFSLPYINKETRVGYLINK